jgi:hypothetical protein
MKAYSKITMALFLLMFTTTSEAQSTQRFYDDNEIILPNFLEYDTQDIQKSVVRGTMNKNVVILSWQTKAETNTSHFELQRSENGVDFDPIETITAGGVSKKTTRYATTDFKYSIGKSILYYRVKTVFINGLENFTEPITVEVKMGNLVKSGSSTIWKSTQPGLLP